jgi:hypothetical protein
LDYAAILCQCEVMSRFVVVEAHHMVITPVVRGGIVVLRRCKSCA